MRMMRASVGDSFKVHKTYTEYLSDLGKDVPEDLYKEWLIRLSDENQRFNLIMHGKKIIGMAWGRVFGDLKEQAFLVEGIFLRRAYRGKYRFSKAAIEAKKELVSDFKKVLMIIPQSRSKIPKRYRAVGTLVEIKGA